MTTAEKRAVVLVGHGGIPENYPREKVMKLKRLEGQRRESGSPPSDEELKLDSHLRNWPRTPENDPYKVGIESLGEQLRPLLNGALFALAYNEFCAPRLEEAVEDLIKKGAQNITVVSSMATPGGSHSEIEIPESIEQLRLKHPHTKIRYAWPYSLNLIAQTLAQHIRSFDESEHQSLYIIE